jgi:hypothetical protein
MGSLRTPRLTQLLETGHMYILLFFVPGLAVPALLLWRGIVRARREALFRWTIILLTFAAVSFWSIVSRFMLDIITGADRVKNPKGCGFFEVHSSP